MNSVVQDVRYAVRTFSRQPAFTSVVVLTLALGVGSNAAIFSVANAVLFRPLPYQDPQELVLVWNRSSSAEAGRRLVSGPDYLDYIEQTTMFEDFAGAFAINGTMMNEGRAEQLMMGWSTQNMFEVLGVRPLLGRDFNDEDVVPIDPQEFMDPNAKIPPGTLILGYALWQQRFGGDPGVLGRSVELDGLSNTIVGVLPRDFRIYLPQDAGMPTDIDVWRVLPVDFDTNPRDVEWLTVVTRLKDGFTLEQGQAQMDSLAARLREQFQFHENSGMQIELQSMHRDIVRHVRPLLLVLLGAVGFVLLIACANVANLLLVRAAAREREIAVRSALGGGRGRIIRQMLTESLVLSFGGGLAGLAVAWGGIRILLALRPDNLPRLERVGIDTTVLFFTLAATVLSAALFGIAPALRASRSNLVDSLKERGSDMGGIRSNKIRTVLVVVEVALSLVLLIGAGLMMRSFVALQRVEPGFRPERVLTFSAPLPVFKYRDPAIRTETLLQLRQRIESLPGVRSAGSVSPLPLAGGDQYYVFSYGRVDATDEEWVRNKADYRWAMPGYFEAMGIRLVSGRFLEDADNRDGALDVALIDELLASRTWPGEDPLGQQLHVERFNLDDFTLERVSVQVVGVVAHVRSESLSAEGREAVYFPHRAFPFAPQSFAVLADKDPAGLAGAIRHEVSGVDPEIPVADLQPMDDYVKEAMAQTRFTLTLIAVFSVLALVLAIIGLYGVISYSVRQRTTEIGVRMVFGAREGAIVRLVVGQGMILGLSGVALGLLVAFLLTRMVSSLLFGITATDPMTFAGISLLLIAATVLASYVPARRAMRVDPVVALRNE